MSRRRRGANKTSRAGSGGRGAGEMHGDDARAPSTAAATTTTRTLSSKLRVPPGDAPTSEKLPVREEAKGKRNATVAPVQMPKSPAADGQATEGRVGGWVRRLLAFMFAKEEFVETPVVAEVTSEQVRTFQVVDRLLPPFAKRPVFYAVDFFTTRRVMLVLLLIAVLLGYYSFHEDVSTFTASFIVADENRPGVRFLQTHRVRRKHPVMIIPGFISTALEVWEDNVECVEAQRSLASNFRQRMFGPRMLLMAFIDPLCYFRLFALDKRTGFDPPGVKIRPDLGFGASDFFMPGYWVWAKVVLNLADIGYDPQSVGIFCYDWRLSPRRMHQRDGYYYYLRNQLLYLYQKNNDKVVVISHSYGTDVLIDFLRWSEEREPGWVDKYMEFWVNLGGPTLGVAKAVSAVLAGDAKDTLTLPGPVRQVLDSHLSRELRTETMRTWSCLSAMYPFGCDAMFPDLLTLSNGTRLTPRQVLQLTARRLRESDHAAQREHIEEILEHFDELPSLPPSPNLTVFCLYGVDRPTEVGYIFGDDEIVNLTYQQPGRAINGVVFGNGDGTVPLMSLGYMCRAENGWKRNVGRVITRELKHSTGSMMELRGGSNSGDHVDMLGNYELIETILKIVSGNAGNGELTDRMYSDVDAQIAAATECATKKNLSPLPP
ncbi:phospholipid:diacylglycerol acyltransferase [Trypanosoma conorhini]|uniref:Phospholipid:diacylglycerol acyltransferase n=1 Tax=Trypanosoma conorhini TaxID=83891 RepID=A0A3R7KU08_9TRYP|nr:phospholipid:diacylglycerol acyltransferase [Trypanosoma conorhini]RNF01348.1 phospholipid:diacylglycerol acyltransferase [Trypanosoma conorhini]